MSVEQQTRIASTLTELLRNAKYDYLKMTKEVVKSIYRPLTPADFKHMFLSISQEQGEHLRELIQEQNLKNIVEFGTSFGISTLYLAQGVLETGGRIITTELIEVKALKAIENFKKAGVSDLIEVRIGDAMETLKNHQSPIDLLLLDGWKDLYHPLFQLLEPNFHSDTLIYVDNADMGETQAFLKKVRQEGSYDFQTLFDGKVVLIRRK